MASQIHANINHNKLEQADKSRLIRTALKANAAFSALSGLSFVLAAPAVASFIGLNAPWIILTTGVLLLMFAADLLFLATRTVIQPIFVKAVIAADALWVLGSVALLIGSWVPFTAEGKWAIGIVAGIVALFADWQYFGLRKLR